MNDFDEDHDPYDMDMTEAGGSSSELHHQATAAAGGSPTHTPTRRPRQSRRDSTDDDGHQLATLDSQQHDISSAYAFDDQHHGPQDTAGGGGGLSLADELGGLSGPAADEPHSEPSSLADEMTRLSTFTIRPQQTSAGPAAGSAGAAGAAADDKAVQGIPQSSAHSSLDSTYTNHEAATPSLHDEEAAEARVRQQEAQLQDLAKSITESVSHTDDFLAKLRGPDRPAAAAPGPFITTRGPTHAPARDIDRLEAVGLAIGTSLRDQAEERLAQVRELRDIERALSRDDPALWMALAHVVGSAAVAAAAANTAQLNGDTTSSAHDDATAQLDFETALSPPAPQDVLGYTRDGASTAVAATSSTPTSATYDDLRGPSLRSSPLSSHLSHLTHLTASLTTSLRSVSESLQISAASSREAAKRLRALKKGVDEARVQEEELERCRRGIEREEMEDGKSDAAASRRRRSEALRREMEGMRVAFERVEGHVKEKGWGQMVRSEVLDKRLDEVAKKGGWPEGYRSVVEQFPGVAGLV